MENKVDFIELAKYCKTEIANEVEQSQRKRSYHIVYAAIYKDGSIRMSVTPHILKEAERCFLIHQWHQLAETISYATYQIQSINDQGEVSVGKLDDEYRIHIFPERFNISEIIQLTRNGDVVYETFLWNKGEYILEKEFVFIWELYKKCKQTCKTAFESVLLGKLAKQEKSIKDLEDRLSDSSIKEEYLNAEIRRYKELIDALAAKTDC